MESRVSAKALRVVVLTLFPEMFDALTLVGVTGRAVDAGLLKLSCINPREFTTDRHRTVDDRPFGGGPGMVMKAEPLALACEQAKAQLDEEGYSSKVLYLSPQGAVLRQAQAQSYIDAVQQDEAYILVAGRYEGVDERFIGRYVDAEVSIGDYVLSGGELPAMVLLDAMTRLVPNVLGHELSAQQDSFSGESQGLLDCPHYTRPESYSENEEGGNSVPPVLLSGNHEAIRLWRLKQSLGQTWLKRPDLLFGQQRQDQEYELLSVDDANNLCDEEKRLLQSFIDERQG